MPIESQVVIGAIVLIFTAFMVLLAWAERRAGGSFDGAIEADARADAADAPGEARPAAPHDRQQAA